MFITFSLLWSKNSPSKIEGVAAGLGSMTVDGIIPPSPLRGTPPVSEGEFYLPSPALIHHHLIGFGLKFVNEQAAINWTVVERNAMFVFEIDDAGKIWISGNQSACHAAALFCQKLSDAVIENFQLFRISKTYSVFGIEEYRRTGLWWVFWIEVLSNLRLGKITGGDRWFLSDDIDVGVCDTCKTYSFSNKLTGVTCNKCGKVFNRMIKARDLPDDYWLNTWF